jgi:hypothetical protein
VLTLTATAHSPADAPAVLRAFLNGVTWPLWSPVDGFALERRGRVISGWTAPERVVGPQVVGDVRVFRTGRRVRRHRITEITESSVTVEITGARAGSRVSVEITGARAGSRVSVESTVRVWPDPAGGSLIVWSSTLRPIRRPGWRPLWFAARRGRRELQSRVAGLARFAALSDATASSRAS